MTVAATIVLPEVAARTLTDAIGEHDQLAGHSVDLNEVAPDTWRITIYFDLPPTREARDALVQLLRAAAHKSGPQFEFAELPETDWVAKSLKGLAPVRAGRFLVHGRHDRGRARANDIAIEIEAGLAFGTGHHATTAGCLIAIDRLARQRTIVSALDLGTGSAVLAIALAKCTRAAIIASDIDPVAVDVAHANVRLNGVAARVSAVAADGVGHRLIRARAPYDLIVANILAAPLVALAPAIRRALAKNGTVILSGLLAEQGRRVAAIYRGLGLRRAGTLILDGWATLTFRR